MLLIRLLRSPQGRLGLALTVLVVAAVLAAPWIAPHDPLALSAGPQLAAPSPAYPMGTDALGRDVLSRILHGGRSSLWVATFAVGGALLIALVLGTAAGMLGGKVDGLTMRTLDVLFAVPSTLLAIAILGFLGTGPMNATIAIMIVFIAPLTRVVRAGVMATRHRAYVEAARVVGLSPVRIVTGHVLPNSLAPVMVQAAVFFGLAIIIEASLSFLGLGQAPPAPSWGEMLAYSRSYLSVGPWIAFFPGLAIAIAVIGVNLLGDGLRDATDPLLVRG